MYRLGRGTAVLLVLQSPAEEGLLEARVRDAFPFAFPFALTDAFPFPFPFPFAFYYATAPEMPGIRALAAFLALTNPRTSLHLGELTHDFLAAHRFSLVV